jgi:hypothetical protein
LNDFPYQFLDYIEIVEYYLMNYYELILFVVAVVVDDVDADD